MARIRYVKPEFFTDSDLCELSPLHRLLFQGLWCQADRDGILEDKPRELKVKVLPFDDCDVENMLAALAHCGFIVRYEAGGQRLISIPGMAEHQKFHKDEKPRGYPLPDEPGSVSRASTVPAPSQHGASTVPAGRVTETGNGELKRGTGNGEPPESPGGVLVGFAPVDSVTRLVHPPAPKDDPRSSPGRRAEDHVQPASAAQAAHASGPPFAERMDAVFLAATGKPYGQSEPERLRGLNALMRVGGWSEAEALRRWAIALSPAGKKRKSVATWLELAWKWDHFAADVEPEKSKSTGDRARLS